MSGDIPGPDRFGPVATSGGGIGRMPGLCAPLRTSWAAASTRYSCAGSRGRSAPQATWHEPRWATVDEPRRATHRGPPGVRWDPAPAAWRPRARRIGIRVSTSLLRRPDAVTQRRRLSRCGDLLNGLHQRSVVVERCQGDPQDLAIFFWSVMIVSARCNFRCSRRFSASSWVTRGSTGRGVGPRRRPRISRRAPASRCRRQFVRSDEYNPSRRNRAPTSPGFSRVDGLRMRRGREAPPLDRRRHLRIRGAGRGHGRGVGVSRPPGSLHPRPRRAVEEAEVVGADGARDKLRAVIGGICLDQHPDATTNEEKAALRNAGEIFDRVVAVVNAGARVAGLLIGS